MVFGSHAKGPDVTSAKIDQRHIDEDGGDVVMKY